MKMEISADSEDVSNRLVGALSAVRDLLVAHTVDTKSVEVDPGNLGYLLEILRDQAQYAHEARFGQRAPKASNND